MNKEDILLKKFFEPERWENAIDVGVGKKIDKGEMRALCSPETRSRLLTAMITGNYEIAPPHVALIPKDKPGEFREVMICENIDRIVLSIVNNLFFEMFPEMVHKRCFSYQSGIGCGKVVKEVSRVCIKANNEIKGNIIGKKYDLSKYFDSVKLMYINLIFMQMEKKVGHSVLIDIVRNFYHTNWLFDENGKLIQEYKSIKQGTATSSFLADAILYMVDEHLSNMENISYWRYSDDILIIGDDYIYADITLKTMLADMGLCINPRKEQDILKDKWFKFLGFMIKGHQITLSPSRVKDFQKEIESRTIKTKSSMKQAVNNVNRYLYIGNEKYSWATSVLPVINVQKDIDTLNTFVMDCCRACATGKKKVGGLGCDNNRPDYTIMRGTGKNVTANRNKTEKEINGYVTIKCMYNAIITDKRVYETLVREIS